MEKQVNESMLLRKCLLGIRLTPFTNKPVLEINDWKIFDAGRVDILPPEARIRNLNFQIERGEQEKILVRMFLSADKKVIDRTKFYYLQKNTDEELALYMTLALLAKVEFKISPDHELLPFAF